MHSAKVGLAINLKRVGRILARCSLREPLVSFTPVLTQVKLGSNHTYHCYYFKLLTCSSRCYEINSAIYNLGHKI